ncbi:MAG: hypothetical protein GY821_00895 [Gammaproteobacteria bacterium]|nr:hypothetical protein [Gammaproteobacteria bacterium]
MDISENTVKNQQATIAVHERIMENAKKTLEEQRKEIGNLDEDIEILSSRIQQLHDDNNKLVKQIDDVEEFIYERISQLMDKSTEFHEKVIAVKDNIPRAKSKKNFSKDSKEAQKYQRIIQEYDKAVDEITKECDHFTKFLFAQLEKLRDDAGDKFKKIQERCKKIRKNAEESLEVVKQVKQQLTKIDEICIKARNQFTELGLKGEAQQKVVARLEQKRGSLIRQMRKKPKSEALSEREAKKQYLREIRKELGPNGECHKYLSDEQRVQICIILLGEKTGKNDGQSLLTYNRRVGNSIGTDSCKAVRAMRDFFEKRANHDADKDFDHVYRGEEAIQINRKATHSKLTKEDYDDKYDELYTEQYNERTELTKKATNLAKYSNNPFDDLRNEKEQMKIKRQNDRKIRDNDLNDKRLEKGKEINRAYRDSVLRRDGLCLMSSAKANEIISQKECNDYSFKNGKLLGAVDKAGNIKVWQWDENQTKWAQPKDQVWEWDDDKQKKWVQKPSDNILFTGLKLDNLPNDLQVTLKKLNKI